MNETLSDIGEKELLNRLKKYMPAGQIDDDSAEIDGRNKKLLINTDVLVEGIHFNASTIDPESLGWKAIATNISDLISCGLEEVIGIRGSGQGSLKEFGVNYQEINV